MDEDKVLISVEVPRKKYYNEDILKAVMLSEVLYYKSKDGSFISLPVKAGNKKQVNIVLKIFKDFFIQPKKKDKQKGEKNER